MKCAALLGLLLWTVAPPPLAGSEVARWEAATPPKAEGIRVERAADSDWWIERTDAGEVARLTPSSDFYTRAAYHISLTPPAGKLWPSVEFLDRGYGSISLSPGLPETKQSGIARLNTGRLRRAVFTYDRSPPPERLRLEGLDYLRAIVLTDQEPPLEQSPLVEPAVKFSAYSERVTSAAGEAANPDRVDEVLAGLRNHLPLVRGIGFNGVESYVRWGWVERKPGIYDWSYHDAILNEIERHGLQWFPMLLAGSGYALPAWLYESTNNVGFKCLEHGIVHDTQSIFYPFQAEYAKHFIAEFGKHYANRKLLLGIRLGPSGDYGEAQYPAKGPGYNFRAGHTHIGYWAGDDYAQAAFREQLKKKYGDITRLNAAWESRYESFGQIATFLPETAVTRRERLDFANWYMDAMSEWCEQWAIWSRQALSGTVILQSSGGWGPVPIGTDFSYQAHSMSKIRGGLRLTNEGDDFPDNFTITRMASSAARFYGIPLGYEPGVITDASANADGTANMQGPAFLQVGTWDAAGTNFTPNGALWNWHWRGVLQTNNSFQLSIAGYGVGGTIDGLRLEATLTRGPAANPFDPTVPWLYAGTINPPPLSTTLFADDFSEGLAWTILKGGGTVTMNVVGGQLVTHEDWTGVAPGTSYLYAYAPNGAWSVGDGQTLECQADLVSLSQNATNVAFVFVGAGSSGWYQFNYESGSGPHSVFLSKHLCKN